MPLDAADVTIILIIIAGFVMVGVASMIQSDHFADDDAITIPHTHYVKFRIIPECRHCGIAAWASDDLPMSVGYTDDLSEISFWLEPYAKYHVFCPDANISILVYPVENLYVLKTNRAGG